MWSSWRVRERHHIQAADAAVPQVGRHHVFADIELRPGLVAEGGNAAAIDEHALSIGEDDKNAVALAHVDGGHLQLAGMDVGREGMPEQQRQEHGHRQRRRRCATSGRAPWRRQSGRPRKPRPATPAAWECASRARCRRASTPLFAKATAARPRSSRPTPSR